MNKAVEVARGYIGQTEKKGNAGFVDAEFEKEMRKVGFYTGAPWCGFFARLVWKRAGGDWKLLKGSAVGTMMNATMVGNWHKAPEVGSIGVMRDFVKGKPQRTGHIFIVVAFDDYHLTTIEGNTNRNGSREGTEVLQKTRLIDWKEKNGKRLMGFIHFKAI